MCECRASALGGCTASYEVASCAQQNLISAIQLLSRARLFATPWTAAHQTYITHSRSLLKLRCIKSVMPFNHLILCLSPSPAFNLSHHQDLFQRVNSSHQVAKGLEFQLQHQSFQ